MNPRHSFRFRRLGNPRGSEVFFLQLVYQIAYLSSFAFQKPSKMAMKISKNGQMECNPIFHINKLTLRLNSLFSKLIKNPSKPISSKSSYKRSKVTEIGQRQEFLGIKIRISDQLPIFVGLFG